MSFFFGFGIVKIFGTVLSVYIPCRKFIANYLETLCFYDACLINVKSIYIFEINLGKKLFIFPIR